MSRNLMQDMVKVKSSQPIVLPKIMEEKIKEENKIIGGRKIPPVGYDRSGKKPKYKIYLVALISVGFLLFALSYLFSGANITLTPKVKDLSLNENLTADKDASTAGLPFDLVIITGEENKKIEGGEEKEVAVKATGTVVLFNSFSSSPQNLNIDTRLEGTNGKVYKTSKKVTVPGMNKTTGKPGSAEVQIYASSAGEDYNSGPMDFTIIGFKGTPKYTKIFAKSKGGKDGEIKGGMVGKAPVISDLDKAGAVSELKTKLEANLSKKVQDQIPSGFILFKDATFLNINDDDVKVVSNNDKTANINVKGTLYGFLFNQQKLTKKIAEDTIDKYDGSEVYIPNLKDLTFTLKDKESISFSDVKNIDFTLSGTPKIIWKVDEEKFVSDILNKNKSDFNQILSHYPSIDTAQLVIRPFWKSNFPEKAKSIKITVNYPN